MEEDSVKHDDILDFAIYYCLHDGSYPEREEEGCAQESSKREDYSPTAWLTDDIIEAAQRLIQENNPLVGGLQPPYLRQTCLLTMETEKFIQVVRNGAGHWLVVTNIGVQWCMTAYTSALPQVQNSK